MLGGSGEMWQSQCHENNDHLSIILTTHLWYWECFMASRFPYYTIHIYIYIYSPIPKLDIDGVYDQYIPLISIYLIMVMVLQHLQPASRRARQMSGIISFRSLLITCQEPSAGGFFGWGSITWMYHGYPHFRKPPYFGGGVWKWWISAREMEIWDMGFFYGCFFCFRWEGYSQH